MTDMKIAPATANGEAEAENPDAPAPDMRISERFEFTPEPTHQIASSKGVLATARAQHGGSTIVNRPVEDGDIVTVKGIEMKASDAMNLGFLKTDEDGQYTDVTDAEFADADGKSKEVDEERKRAEEKAELQEHSVVVSSEASTTLATFMSDVEAIGANPAGAVNDFFTDPTKLPAAMEHIATEKGENPLKLLMQITKVANEVQEGVEDYMIGKLNFDPDQLSDFWSWAQSTSALELRSAAMTVMTTGDCRPYQRMVERFRLARGSGRGTSQYPVSTVKVGSKSIEVVDHPKYGRMSLAGARKLGWA